MSDHKNSQAAAARGSTEAVTDPPFLVRVAMKGANKDLLSKVNDEEKVQNCLWNHEILVLNLFPVDAGVKYLMLCLHAKLASPDLQLHEISFKQSWNSSAVHRFLRSVCLGQLL